MDFLCGLDVGAYKMCENEMWDKMRCSDITSWEKHESRF